MKRRKGAAYPLPERAIAARGLYSTDRPHRISRAGGSVNERRERAA